MGLPVPSGCLPLALCDFIIAQAARYVKSFFLVAPSFFKGAGSSLATTTPDYFAYRASLGFRGANPRRLLGRRSLRWGVLTCPSVRTRPCICIAPTLGVASYGEDGALSRLRGAVMLFSEPRATPRAGLGSRRLSALPLGTIV